ncbi:MAG: RNA polymerase subunit sigma-70, partial [bacterium]|nr:RNA polymerase subunit sigma-70 [bacterium]
FFGAAAQIMRRLLVDHARHRQAAKRGGGAPKLPVDEDLPVLDRHDPEEILALDEALGRLEALEPRQSQVVALKSFVGLTIPEIAQTLGIGQTAVKSDWRFARAWLERELRA